MAAADGPARPAASSAAWILDVCTGTGDLALAYCKATGQDARVVGTDFCRPMLTFAQAKRRRAEVQPRLDLFEADSLALPFPDGVFRRRLRGLRAAKRGDTDAGLREMVARVPAGGASGGARILDADRLARPTPLSLVFPPRPAPSGPSSG